MCIQHCNNYFHSMAFSIEIKYLMNEKFHENNKMNASHIQFSRNFISNISTIVVVVDPNRFSTHFFYSDLNSFLVVDPWKSIFPSLKPHRNSMLLDSLRIYIVRSQSVSRFYLHGVPRHIHKWYKDRIIGSILMDCLSTGTQLF